MKIKMEMGDVKIEVESKDYSYRELIIVIENTALQLCGMYQEQQKENVTVEDIIEEMPKAIRMKTGVTY